MVSVTRITRVVEDILLPEAPFQMLDCRINPREYLGDLLLLGEWGDWKMVQISDDTWMRLRLIIKG